MVSRSRTWTVVGAVVAGTYLAGIALWGSWATQGAAFTALSVAVVLGSALRLGELVASKIDRFPGTTRDSRAD